MGLSFGKLAHFDRLNPLIFSVSALGQAARQRLVRLPRRDVAHTAKT